MQFAVLADTRQMTTCYDVHAEHVVMHSISRIDSSFIV